MSPEKTQVSNLDLAFVRLPLTRGDADAIEVIHVGHVSSLTCRPVSTKATMALERPRK